MAQMAKQQAERPSSIKEVLKRVVEGIDNMVLPITPGGARVPIDCVALEITESLDGERRVAHYVFPACLHPDRGKQMGCLLLDEDKTTGRAIRKKGASCRWRVKSNKRGAAALAKRIQAAHEDEIWR